MACTSYWLANPDGGISDGYSKVVKTNGKVPTTKDLTWAESWTLIRWKLKYDCSTLTRPRASWAQLLMAFGIRDPSRLVYRFADAGMIPAAIDTPLQRIKLHDLGVLALMLGFKKVDINIAKREFEAQGQHGTITTIRTNELGKVLHFEADILAVIAQISKGTLKTYIEAYNPADGQFSFGPEFRTTSYLCPLQLLPRATAEDWEGFRFDPELQKCETQAIAQGENGHNKGLLPTEASLFTEIRELQDAQARREAVAAGLKHATSRQDAAPSSVRPSQKDDPEFVAQPLARTTTGLNTQVLSTIVNSSDDNPRDSLSEVCVSLYGLPLVHPLWELVLTPQP
jgi:hypothetical protein